MGSKLFPSLKYTFHSIYSNTSPSSKHKLQNNLFKHTMGWVYVHIPILLLHSHFPLSKKIMLQHDSNYSTTHFISMGSKLFPSLKYSFLQYILTPVHPLITSYKIIYLNTLWVGFMSTYPFYSSTAISPCPKNYVTT